MPNLDQVPLPTINHPRVLLLGGGIITFVLTFFVVCESPPVPLSPAAVAPMGSALVLLLAHHSKIDTMNHILRDVDWSTLLFFMCIFVLIGGLTKIGIVAQLSGILAIVLGQNIVAAGIAEQHDRRISFRAFLHYGLPVMIMQLIAAAICVLVRFLI